MLYRGKVHLFPEFQNNVNDELSFIFNIPATDPLGKLALTGKFRAMEEQVVLHYWRAFEISH